MMTDPAQSAPSAEQCKWTHAICDDCWECLHQRDRQTPARLLPEYTEKKPCCLCGTEQQSGIFIRRDPAKMPCRVALRTAQQSLQNEELLSAYRARQKYLEDTIADLETKHSNIIKMQAGMFREKRDELLTHAETAESALRDAKTVVERVLMVLPTAIYGCEGCGGSGVRSISEHHPSCHGDCEQCPVEGQVQCECEGKKVDVAGLLDEMRALLTVAAQTPEEK